MPLDEAYFTWLYSQVGSVKNRNRAKTYWKLLRILHGKEFTWTNIEKDANRAKDGMNLRRDFLRVNPQFEEDPMWMGMGCSMLELLVSLASWLAFEGDGETDVWFWALIDNLGLLDFTDANPPDEFTVNYILDKVINRDYARNGAGGLFPLQRTRDDQRKVELWYQLNAYLLERL